MAATAGGLRAGKAFIEILADDSRLRATLRRASQRLRNFGQNVQALGRRLVGFSAALGLPAALAVRTFATFERAMSAVRAITGATEQQFEALRQKALQLGESTAFSAREVAETMVVFARQGFAAREILDVIGPTLDLAAAGAVDLATAAGIAGEALRQFGLPAREMQRVLDVITKAANTSNQTVVDFGEAMKLAGPIAKTAGLSIEETAAAIAVLANSGIKATLAGTAIRGVLLGLTSPSKEAAEVLESLGVQVRDAFGNVRPLVEIVRDLRGAIQGVGTAEALRRLGVVFGRRQAAAAAVLARVGPEAVQDFVQSFQQAAGTAAQVAGVMLDNLAGDAILLRSAIEGVAISFGNALNNALRQTTQRLTEAALALSRWIRQNAAVVLGLARFVAGSGGAGIGLIALGTALRLAAFGLSVFLFPLRLAVRILRVLPALFAGTKAAVIAAAASFRTLGIAMSVTFPAMLAGIGRITLAIGAIGAAVLGLRSVFRRVSGSFGDFLAGMNAAIQAGDVVLSFRIMWAEMKVVAFSAIDAIRDGFNDLLRSLGIKFAESGRQLTDRLGAELFLFFEDLRAEIVDAGTSLKAFFDIARGRPFAEVRAQAQQAFRETDERLRTARQIFLAERQAPPRRTAAEQAAAELARLRRQAEQRSEAVVESLKPVETLPLNLRQRIGDAIRGALNLLNVRPLARLFDRLALPAAQKPIKVAAEGLRVPEGIGTFSGAVLSRLAVNIVEPQEKTARNTTELVKRSDAMIRWLQRIWSDLPSGPTFK